MSEKVESSVPGIHPVYNRIAFNPESRQVGIQSAVKTIAEVKGREEALRLQNSLFYFSQDLDANVNACAIGQDTACRTAIIFAAEIALEIQEADKIRISRNSAPTILFEIAEHMKHSNGSK